jgi:zinc transporter ZupT
MFMSFFVDTASPAVLASLIAAALATLGLFAVWLKKDWMTTNSGLFSAFAAGVLITTALRLIPEGMESTQYAPYLVLFGYLFMYIINLVFKEPTTGGFALAPFFAIALHSFIDGLEYGILFEHDNYIGLIASVGLISHEFAEGVILFAILQKSGMNRSLAFIMAFIGAALTTPAGAVVAVNYLGDADHETIGILLSLAAGALLYVGATHLPKHMETTKSGKSILFYIAGIAVALAMNIAHHKTFEGQHGHHHGAHHEDRHDHDDHDHD